MALRAQSQCRATWETLSTVQNPPIAGYVRQTNITHGHQQVNNTSVTVDEPSRVRENKNPQTKLLEKIDGKRLDPGATGKGFSSNSSLEAVGALDRTTD